MGVIMPVQQKDIPTFLKNIRQDNAPDFDIHPETEGKPHYIITYIEPESLNTAAVGLNIGFEKNRQDAAELSRDTGKSAITHRIILVQDKSKTPGFLLLHPMYVHSMPGTTPDERRKAFRGWVYAPFIAKNFMGNLTNSQDKYLHLEVYDGSDISPENLIFDDEGTEDYTAHTPPKFTIKKKITVMQRDWTLVWKSTKAFEKEQRSEYPLFIITGGLLFTGLFGLFLMTTMVRSAEAMEFLTGRGVLVLPLVIFMAMTTGSLYLSNVISQRERAYISAEVDAEAKRISEVIRVQTMERLIALQRMAKRWEAGGGTPEKLWRADVANYRHDMPGMKAVEWIDKTYHIRWVEPVRGNETAAGIDIRIDGKRKKALVGAEEKGSITLTPPLDLLQGYRGFIAYVPLHINNSFDGFIAGLFSVDEFFEGLVAHEALNNYAVYLDFEGEQLFYNKITAPLAEGLTTQDKIDLFNRQVTVRMTPTAEFAEGQKSHLHYFVFAGGLLIATLLSLTVRYVLISRLRAYYLEQSRREIQEKSQKLTQSDALKSAILSSTQHMVIAGDMNGTITIFNRAAEKALGYSASDVIGKKTPLIWHDPLEVSKKAAALTAELGLNVPPGFDAFIRKADIEGSDENEWTFIRKDGSRFPVSMTVSPLRTSDGEITGYVGIAIDITKRKEMERMKSEFISIVSHELRTPLTSIRGSLGLIAGTMMNGLPEKLQQLIDIAYKNSERLLLLINDMLDIDKIVSGHMQFDIREEPLFALISQAIEANRPYADKFGVSVTARDFDPDIMIKVDAGRFLQILANLISNAAKFSNQGGAVEIFTSLSPDKVRISVQDHGAGIPEEFKSRIFDRFSQADSTMTRKKGGTGLGLHISQKLTEGMNGSIGFETELGKGTTFWVEFPAHKDKGSTT